MNNVSIYISFFAGIVSFLSPCVLPIIPGFLAYLAGAAGSAGNVNRREVFLNSLFFVLGFSIVFSALGVLLNSVLSYLAYDLQIWLSRLGGLIIIFFGLYLTKLINVPWLSRDHKLAVKTKFKSKYLTSMLFGFAFAAGWTPCVGAALGAILALAAAQPAAAFSLLLAYSLGLGLPFLIIGLFTAQAAQLISKLGKTLDYLNIAFGYILIILGVLVFTQSLSLVANFDFVNKLIQG